ncbi:MAG: NAD kinase [Holosporales bacterium]|jgi:NAD+ kinase|nr:NAD kinase [Holosporales bacterium]
MVSASLKIHFTFSAFLKNSSLAEDLVHRYGQASPEACDVIVVLGGDGLMLETMHRFLALNKPFYGIHSGTIGFLMNEPPLDLQKNLTHAEATKMTLLGMRATTASGKVVEAPAINEVSLLRNTRQAAKIELCINNVVRLSELICDGILLSTPAGSTAYNLSVGGPILPLGAPLLLLTPISPFRPRRWRGAILPETVHVTWNVLEKEKRPVSVVADHLEVRDVVSVEMEMASSLSLTLLFDPHHNLEGRILNEQFAF